MIDLGRPALHAEGVTLFPDHAERRRFHYLADAPRLRLTADGAPELSLLKYRLDPELHQELGAGLLSLTVDLGVEPERLERLRRRLAARGDLGGPAELAPVGADEGRCELVLIDRSSRDETPPPAGAPAGATGFGLVERILGAATPSLYGDNAATFMAVLSAEGVALVEGALRGGGLPAGVVYTLRTSGLRPALRAEITARWHDVYSFYENRLHGGKLLLATDIGPTLEDLVHAEAISIKVDDLVPSEERPAVFERALEQAQRYILEELFTPTLGQAPPPEDGDDSALATIGRAIKDFAGFFSFTYSLRQIDRDELKTFRYQLAASRAERLTLAPQGTFQVLLDGGGAVPLERLIVAVEPAAAAEMRFDVGSAVDLAAEEIDHLEVWLRYGGREETFLLDAATPRRQVTLFHRPEAGLAVAWRYEVHFRPGAAGLGGRLASPEWTAEERVVRIDPRELYQKSAVRAVAQGLPFDRYPLVLVDLRAHDPAAGWTAEQTLELDAAHPEAAFRVRAGLEAPLRFERRLRYVDAHGVETLADWDEAEPGVLVVGDPLPEVVDVQILGSARFGTEVERLIVELRPTADPSRVAVRVLTAEQPSATWSWAAPEGADRSYQYRVTVHTVRNEVREGQWLPGPPGKFQVGEGIARLRQVQLLLLGPKISDLGLLAVKVRFAFEDPESGLFAEEEMLIEDSRAPVRWSYPVADPARQAYTWQLTLIRGDGTLDVRPPVTTTDLLLVQPLA